jgi:hypothetical protein
VMLAYVVVLVAIVIVIDHLLARLDRELSE